MVTAPTRVIPVRTRNPTARGWLPEGIVELVRHLESSWTLADLEIFERGLADNLGATDVLCVWMDWPRRLAWSASGIVSPRLQELVPEVAGSGRRVVLPNALIEPIGPAPARAALVGKGDSEARFQTYVLRLIARVAARIAPALERLIAH